MAHPKFSIGIDLGTSNSVFAFSPLSGEGGSEVLAIPQWDTSSTVTEFATVPSFLYLPEEAIAAQISGPRPRVRRVGRGQAGATQGQRNAGARRPVREVLAVSSRRRPLDPIPAMGIGCAGAAGQNLSR